MKKIWKKLSRFGYCPASEEYRPRFEYSSAEEQAMFTGQSPASRKVQNMSTENDSFGFFLPSSLYLLFPLRVAELVIYVYDRQPGAGKSQVHMVRSVTRYS
jgi:hypothetical protein